MWLRLYTLVISTRRRWDSGSLFEKEKHTKVLTPSPSQPATGCHGRSETRDGAGWGFPGSPLRKEEQIQGENLPNNKASIYYIYMLINLTPKTLKSLGVTQGL